MFQTINGVQIREHDETKTNLNLLDKCFEIEYLDNVYLHKLVCLDLINIYVKGHKRKYGLKIKKDYGRQWMFVVKDTDFTLNRKKWFALLTIKLVCILPRNMDIILKELN